jgi:hypothetical protein
MNRFEEAVHGARRAEGELTSARFSPRHLDFRRKKGRIEGKGADQG